MKKRKPPKTRRKFKKRALELSSGFLHRLGLVSGTIGGLGLVSLAQADTAHKAARRRFFTSQMITKKEKELKPLIDALERQLPRPLKRFAPDIVYSRLDEHFGRRATKSIPEYRNVLRGLGKLKRIFAGIGAAGLVSLLASRKLAERARRVK